MAHYTDWPEYPTALLDLTDYPTQTDDVEFVEAWLINALVHEMIAVQAELGTQPKAGYADVDARLDAMLPHYHDRGDPSAYDYTLANLTTDGAWHDLDLSSIVPAGATAVNLSIWIKDDLINKGLLFRKNGNTNPYAREELRTQTANIHNTGCVIVVCDANRKIEYAATNVIWTEINITVTGWWK